MGYLSSRSKVRAHERRYARIVRRKRRAGHFYLMPMEVALPSYAPPKVLSVRDYYMDERDLMDGTFTRIKRIKLPRGYEKLKGKEFLIKAGQLLIKLNGAIADPYERCHHQHDCCGCLFAYSAKVVERNGREIVVSQGFGRNI